MRHLTASAVVVHSETQDVLLVHHRAMDKWVFPGGHVEDGEAPHETALREVWEETGIKAVAMVDGLELPGQTVLPLPWVVAEMAAPAKPARESKAAEPAHLHVDFLYVCTAADRRPTGPWAQDEVSVVGWFSLEQIRIKENVREEVYTVAVAAVAGVRASVIPWPESRP